MIKPLFTKITGQSVFRQMTLWLSSIALTCTPFLASSAPSASNEHNLKAALIYKMASYVTWKDTPQKLTYCFIGESSHVIGDILSGKQKLGKLPPHIDVVNKDSFNDDTENDCSVVYITDEHPIKHSVVDALSKTVFTITNSRKALDKGFIASIEIYQNKPLLSISKKNLKRSEISVNSRFLSWVNLM